MRTRRSPVVNALVASALAAALVLVVATPGNAMQVDRNLTVVTVGVADARYGVAVPDVSTAYFSVAEPLTLNCQPVSYIYLDTSATGAFPSQAYQMILMAKESGRKVTRLDYEQRGPAGQCFLRLIQVD